MTLGCFVAVKVPCTHLRGKSQWSEIKAKHVLIGCGFVFLEITLETRMASG